MIDIPLAREASHRRRRVRFQLTNGKNGTWISLGVAAREVLHHLLLPRFDSISPAISNLRGKDE
jgi:hypothetical protein